MTKHRPCRIRNLGHPWTFRRKVSISAKLLDSFIVMINAQQHPMSAVLVFRVERKSYLISNNSTVNVSLKHDNSINFFNNLSLLPLTVFYLSSRYK